MGRFKYRQSDDRGERIPRKLENGNRVPEIIARDVFTNVLTNFCMFLCPSTRAEWTTS